MTTTLKTILAGATLSLGLALGALGQSNFTGGTLANSQAVPGTNATALALKDIQLKAGSTNQVFNLQGTTVAASNQTANFVWLLSGTLDSANFVSICGLTNSVTGTNQSSTILSTNLNLSKYRSVRVSALNLVTNTVTVSGTWGYWYGN